MVVLVTLINIQYDGGLHLAIFLRCILNGCPGHIDHLSMWGCDDQYDATGDQCDAAEDDKYHDVDNQSHDGDNQYHDGDDQYNDGDYQDHDCDDQYNDGGEVLVSDGKGLSWPW